MTNLSPAAQAVDNATCYDMPNRVLAAAAIRALADQVVPAEQYPPRRGMRPGGTGALSPDEGAEDQRAATRRQLIALAGELENAQ